MKTIPCDECNGEGVIDGQECERIRCEGGVIRLTEDELKAIEAREAGIRG